jgi:ABC-2 type transport system ATP-binding protein
VSQEHALAPLAIADVGASYGKKAVFDGVTFSVAPGEVFGLIGLNGAGKTTLIRSILGLRAARGEIRLFGKPCGLTAARRRLVYLPEKFQPSPQLYGWEYLSIMLAYFGQQVDRDRARIIAAGLDLDPAAIDRKVRTYSKGMGQKLGLVGTFLVDASLMILDEPMSGLDPRARVLLKDRLMESRTAGRSVFFSSHILADIEEICDRIAVLHAGKIIFLGTPGDFVSRHAAPSLERAFLASLAETERQSNANAA